MFAASRKTGPPPPKPGPSEAEEDEEPKNSAAARQTMIKRDDDGAVTHANDYELGERLGKGAFGVVYKSQTPDDGTTVAVKVMKRSLLKRKGMGAKSSALDALLREIAVMRKVKHPNCVELVDVLDDPNTDEVFLVMEFVDGGNVQELCAGQPLNEALARVAARDVSLGLRYLHSQGICHRDVKPENMLLVRDVRGCTSALVDAFDRMEALLPQRWRQCACARGLEQQIHLLGDVGALRVKLCDFGVADICDAQTSVVQEEQAASDGDGDRPHMTCRA